MSTLGLALDDAGLALARDGELVSIADSIVDAGREAPEQLGHPARSRSRIAPTALSSRHWADLARGGTATPASRRVACAELGERLRSAGGDPPDVVQVAVPAAFGPGALSQVLAVCRAAALPVTAFVDAAALAVAALGLRGTVVVLELGLHHAAATRVEAGAGEARRRAALVRTRGGRLSLHEAWLQLVSEAMVLRTRFDPLHEAATEQRLYDLLPAAAAAAGDTGSATLALPVAGATVEVTLSRDQFAARAEPLYRDFIDMLHELRPAGAPVLLLADAAVAELPGLREALAEFAGCELLAMSPGLAARAASLLPPAEACGEAGQVPLLRGVAPRDAPLAGGVSARVALGRDDAAADSPTHLLWGGRAVPLPARADAALEIGRAPAGAGLTLPEGMAGVSRLHCTLRAEAGRVVLVDHSRHGTWVNGERVAGRARLRAGDRLRIGEPGVQLELIAVGGGHGEAPQG